ncbi:MAG: ADP-ribosylglycohydrolase family protein [Nitriliruptoraceae bacterium]
MGDRSDHIAGALLGVHVGDSLGATTEFSDRANARELLPDTVEATDIVDGGAYRWPAGAATDDTDLTVALARLDDHELHAAEA